MAALTRRPIGSIHRPIGFGSITDLHVVEMIFEWLTDPSDRARFAHTCAATWSVRCELVRRDRRTYGVPTAVDPAHGAGPDARSAIDSPYISSAAWWEAIMALGRVPCADAILDGSGRDPFLIRLAAHLARIAPQPSDACIEFADAITRNTLDRMMTGFSIGWLMELLRRLTDSSDTAFALWCAPLLEFQLPLAVESGEEHEWLIGRLMDTIEYVARRMAVVGNAGRNGMVFGPNSPAPLRQLATEAFRRLIDPTMPSCASPAANIYRLGSMRLPAYGLVLWPTGMFLDELVRDMACIGWADDTFTAGAYRQIMSHFVELIEEECQLRDDGRLAAEFMRNLEHVRRAISPTAHSYAALRGAELDGQLRDIAGRMGHTGR